MSHRDVLVSLHMNISYLRALVINLIVSGMRCGWQAGAVSVPIQGFPLAQAKIRTLFFLFFRLLHSCLAAVQACCGTELRTS